MSSIRREISIEATVEDAWAALSDFGALHERLAPGFATDARLERQDRIVTFASGAVLRERLVAVDAEAHRLVWSIVDGPYAHHNGSAQVVADGDGRIRFIWVSDLLPDELAPSTAHMMELGLGIIKETLEHSTDSHVDRQTVAVLPIAATP
jgi:hypothetical protein